MALFRKLRRNPVQALGAALYASAVSHARTPGFYLPPPEGFGVPDTLDGRFNMIGLIVSLLIRRLNREGVAGEQAAQALFDAMFQDMDQSLRELGAGDLAVAKRVKEMWEALHGRAVSYGKALDAGDTAMMAEALRRNLWPGGVAPPESAPRLAALARAQDQALAARALSAGAAPAWLAAAP
jgi:cytochrome b pre-mRNA-processing protein 3